MDQNAVYAAVLIDLLATLESFANGGLRRAAGGVDGAITPSRTQPCSLLSDFSAPRKRGICRGVGSDGALLLEIDGRVERVLSGEISLRPA
jgi:BirA family biotin operon repressor/biotin-[acetyl-CoA-carboxylase] ligase